MIDFLFIVLFKFDTKDVVVRNIFHDVRREVWLDFIFATKTATAIFWFVPIGAIEDERDELPLLEWLNEFEWTRFVHVPLVIRFIGIAYRHQREAAVKASALGEMEIVGGCRVIVRGHEANDEFLI